MVTCGVDKVINGERCKEIFLSTFPKGPYRLPYVVLTLNPVTLIPVYYSTFLCDVFLVLGMDFDSDFTTNVFESFT